MRDRLVLILASGVLVLAGCAAPSSHHTRATGTIERRGSAMAAGSAIVFATDPDEGPPILYVVEADGSFVAAFQRGSGVVFHTRELPAAMLARFGAEMDALLASGETVAAAPHSRDSRLYYFSGQGRWEGQWDGVVRPGWGLTAYSEKHGPFLAFATAWVRIAILAANAATVEGTPISREETLGRIQNAAARGALSEWCEQMSGAPTGH